MCILLRIQEWYYNKPGIQQLFIPFHLYRLQFWNEEKDLINLSSDDILDLCCQLCSDLWILSPFRKLEAVSAGDP